MKFKTRGRRGPTSKRITVYSNDPAQPQLMLTVKAQLEIALGLEPRHVNFGIVHRSRGATRNVRFVGRDAARTQVVSATLERLPATLNAVSADSVIRARPGKGDRAGTVELTLAPDAPAGEFHGQLSVKTDHREVPELTARVRANVHGSVIFQPQSVFFKVTEEGVEQSRTLRVAETTAEPLEILGVDVAHPALTATFSPAGQGRVQVTLTCSGKLQRDREATTVVIRTSSEEDPRLEVPVNMYRIRRSTP